MPIHYTDPDLDVPPGVDFVDAGQVSNWVAACEVDKPWRLPMRARFADLVGELPWGAKLLEPGSGPGFLAKAILDNCPNVESFTLLDFSEHMLQLSRATLANYTAAQFVKADFRAADWCSELAPPYTAVIAMQSIHEIRHKRHVPAFYARIRSILEPGGLLAVCDGLPRDPSVLWQVSLSMTVEEQLEALTFAGFTDVRLVQQIGAMILVTGRNAGEA